MGLSNASHQFQMMMDDRLFNFSDLPDLFIDAILVRNKSERPEDRAAEHDRDLRGISH